MSNTTKVQSSFPFLSILCLIFITLKLTGYIAWSWWWVLAPIWIPISTILVVFVIVGMLYVAENNKNK
jgi:CHASE2 domain-containing sensor protein